MNHLIKNSSIAYTFVVYIDICFIIIQKIKDKGLDIGVLDMDDDSSTVARVRRDVDPSIVKRSDSNHVKKNFTSQLYKLKDSTKGLKISTSTMKYLKICFSKALKKNQGLYLTSILLF